MAFCHMQVLEEQNGVVKCIMGGGMFVAINSCIIDVKE